MQLTVSYWNVTVLHKVLVLPSLVQNSFSKVYSFCLYLWFLNRLPWIAPEWYDNRFSLSSEYDVYAFGICLWEIFSYGERPLKNVSKVEVSSLTSKNAYHFSSVRLYYQFSTNLANFNSFQSSKYELI